MADHRATADLNPTSRKRHVEDDDESPRESPLKRYTVDVEGLPPFNVSADPLGEAMKFLSLKDRVSAANVNRSLFRKTALNVGSTSVRIDPFDAKTTSTSDGEYFIFLKDVSRLEAAFKSPVGLHMITELQVQLDRRDPRHTDDVHTLIRLLVDYKHNVQTLLFVDGSTTIDDWDFFVMEVAKMLEVNTKITCLVLDDVSMSNHALDALCYALRSDTVLTDLTIEVNDTNLATPDPDGYGLALLGRNTTLTRLDLGRIMGRMSDILPSITALIKTSKSIETLRLDFIVGRELMESDSHLFRELFSALATSNNTITDLHVSMTSNRIGQPIASSDALADYVGSMLAVNKTLKRLRISGFERVKSLTDGLRRNTTLKHLDVTHLGGFDEAMAEYALYIVEDHRLESLSVDLGRQALTELRVHKAFDELLCALVKNTTLTNLQIFSRLMKLQVRGKITPIRFASLLDLNSTLVNLNVASFITVEGVVTDEFTKLCKQRGLKVDGVR